MSLLQAGARSPRRRLLLSYREKKHTLFFFFPLPHSAAIRARVARVPRVEGCASREFRKRARVRARVHSFVRSIVRALTMRREYEHVLVPSEDGSARAGPATLLNDRETDATRTADRARIFRH